MAWEYLDRNDIDDDRVRQVKKLGTAVHVGEASTQAIVLVPLSSPPARR
jgi:hypothetical protein